MQSELPAQRSESLFAGRYRVESLLGEGGAGTVHRVRDTQSGRRVALKGLRLSGGQQDALLTSQFEREYHTLAQLAHPCIIEVYEYGVEAGAPYYTMELLDGEDLRERGRLPFVEACALLRDVASSLAIVHSRGLVHRDLSARNVRCTKQGRAKLIDFGAMVPMGTSKQLVGTPPFVPPEALQLQALDGRVDLYALGALAYYVLTGRHAYTAQSFAQLKDLWRTAPASPRQYDANLPEALDRLVMELLQLERAARPRSAAEVMERLSGIAGLPAQELPEVQRAYLAMPVLVGREAALHKARTALVESLQGRGASVLIEGAAGVGRSRFLDACVLEAKLLGATVLRAHASDGKQGEHGLTRALCSQLLAALPVLVEQSARPRRAILAHVMPQLRRGDSAPPISRRLLQAALRDFFLTVARHKQVVIAVDDLEDVDEASAALLGMLAHGAARRKLCLLLTAKSAATSTPALSLLRQFANVITLCPLDAEQTRALVQSLFGDVPHLPGLAARVHQLAGGSPRWVMALSERLVERGVARYHAGRWTLPAEIGADVVPASLSAEFEARIAALPPDARELASVLALTEPAAFSLPVYATLVGQPDRGRVYRALDGLVAAAVLVPAGDRYQFSQPELQRLLAATVSPARASVVHARLAEVAAEGDNLALPAHHLLLAGRGREAVRAALGVIASPRMVWKPSLVGQLEHTLALAVEQHVELEPRLLFEMRHGLLYLSGSLGRLDHFSRHVTPLIEQLERDSGLLDYRALGALPAEQRMPEAVKRAQARHEATPEAERVFSPSEAARHLASLASAVIGIASTAQDDKLLERLPDLSPLASMYPPILATQLALDIQRDVQAARYVRAEQRSRAQVERLRAPGHAGVEPRYATVFLLGQLYLQGLIQAGQGREVPPQVLQELEQTPGYRALAWRVRAATEFMHCNFDEGYACERRAELIRLQDGGVLPGTTVRIELLFHLYADDLTGMKQDVARIEELAARYPGWQSTLAIARAHYARLQGDLQGALVALEPAFELVALGRHMDWELAIQSKLRILTALGRHSEALELVRSAEREAQASDNPLGLGCRSAFAITVLAAGDVPAAQQLVDDVIETLRGMASSGLILGIAYETRARVAIAMRDQAALEQYAELSAQQLHVGANSAMNARHERLMRDVSAAGMQLPASARSVAEVRSEQRDLAHTLYSRMLTCIGSLERAREGLRLLLEDSGASTGYLFGIKGGNLQLLASVDETESPCDLTETLEEYLRNELEDDDAARGREAARAAEPIQHWIDSWGREFEPLLLVGAHEGESVVAGVAALHYESDERPALRDGLLQALTEALIAEDIIDPITCVG